MILLANLKKLDILDTLFAKHATLGVRQMKLQPNNYTIAEIRDMFGRKDLVINKEYQRNPKIWPPSAKSYFIDTILEDFPFPKLYFYQAIDRRTKKVRQEVVDGQQRILTIMDFINSRFRLSNASKQHAGKTFADFDEDEQLRFLGNSVSVDVILNAEKTDILEMFRRINSYTLPLNTAEKRHSTFQGKFKWFINNLSDDYAPLFSEFGILTLRQIVRMADAEFLSELIVALKQGLLSASSSTLHNIYKQYEKEFPIEEEVAIKICECLNFIGENMGDLKGTFIMKTYAFYSLCTALLHNKYGIHNGVRDLELRPINTFVVDIENAKNSLEVLAAAHENKEEDGPFAEYVWACLSGTNRIRQRIIRTKYIALALRAELALY